VWGEEAFCSGRHDPAWLLFYEQLEESYSHQDGPLREVRRSVIFE